MTNLVRRLIASSLLIASLLVAPRVSCGGDGPALYAGDARLQAELAAGQARWIRSGVGPEHFHTGSALYDGEWWFGTYLMSALGFGQVALEHPDLAAEQLPLLDACLDALLSPGVRQFDTRLWGGDDALASLAGGHGHAAYLGYLNLALGVRRQLPGSARFDSLHDRITAALRARLDASPTGLVETYPGEAYPVDTLAAAASVGLHARATGAPAPASTDSWVRTFRTRYVDPATRLLVQAASARTGAARDLPRGSGTALAAYFASFVDARLAQELHEAVRWQLASAPLGLGAVREYAPGRDGRGDIDSGPILLGFGVSATGFSLGSARAARDQPHYVSVFRTAALFGGLHEHDGILEFVAGGPLGNAILFAMLTAAPMDVRGAGSP